MDDAATTERNRITVRIPCAFYAGGRPRVSTHMGEPGAGLAYPATGEEAFEMAATFGGSPGEQWLVVGLLSPHVIGADLAARHPRIVSVDLDARTVTLQV
jgi:hypothetical protein